MTIVVWVEGDSDKAALDELLPRFGGQWGQKGVRLDVKVAGGRTKLLRDIGEYAARDFKDKDPASYVFALIDSNDEQPDAALARLSEKGRANLSAELASRFRAHVAVPEMEAWLLADPGALPRAKVGSPRLPANPEALGPGKAKQLLDRYLESVRGTGCGYNGTADARAIASRANPDPVAKKCEHFRRLVEDLARCAAIGEAES